MLREEVFDNLFVLLLQERTRRVDESAAGFQHRKPLFEELTLLRGHLFNECLRHSPFVSRIPPQRAKSATRCINQDCINLFQTTPSYRIAISFSQTHLDVLDTSTLGSLLEISQTAFINIKSDDLPLISHECCKLKSLSSSTCTCINDELAGLGIKHQWNKLAGFVLNFEPSFFEGSD